ncbi:hypothetical protein Vadar_004810 [Vaccinium darrowii]|uniref:Uncharacterized protein n=1 Tax=Vaccinium darrowii TaxID=229202 RepID=A0ACB7XNB1_9ERIC|nr:hypothetical protein Vadar_004810 [Vaccinium darrowii]
MEGDGSGRIGIAVDIQLTPNGNTRLHIAARDGDLRSVNDILQDFPSHLPSLCEQNSKDETPLHMAAREGKAAIVEAMIDRAQILEGELETMLRATNVDDDTALHMAARNCHLESEEDNGSYLKVVKLLIDNDKERKHLPNVNKETPLYLAAERGNKGVAIVDTLVNTCTSLTYSGPHERTALHAAAIKDFTGEGIKRLLDWKEDLEWKKLLINQADAYGWTPLHYAACVGNENGVKELLLRMDISGLYTKTKNKDVAQHSALHIAAAHGHVPVLKEMLNRDQNCWEMVNCEGQNVLHIAVDMNKESVIEFIVSKPWVRYLINQKDSIAANTPLHLLIASDCKVKELWEHKKADWHAFNYKNMTPVDLAKANFKEGRMSTFAATYIIMDDTFMDSGIGGGRNIACNAHGNLAKLEAKSKREKKKREEEKEIIENTTKELATIVIVAALIATITFAATFTIPGGYDPNPGAKQGMAILVREAAFKAFAITNTIAMVSSVTSIFLCITASFYNQGGKDTRRLKNRSAAALFFLLVALFVVMAAIIAAAFAVLAHSVAVIASICIITCFYFTINLYELIKIIYVWREHEASKELAV